MPVPVSVALSWFVSPPEPQPGPNRTVGAFAPGARPAAGKKCSAICVPSNDVIVASRANATGAVSASATATTGAATHPHRPNRTLIRPPRGPSAGHATRRRRAPRYVTGVHLTAAARVGDDRLQPADDPLDSFHRPPPP